MNTARDDSYPRRPGTSQAERPARREPSLRLLPQSLLVLGWPRQRVDHLKMILQLCGGTNNAISRVSLLSAFLGFAEALEQL